MAQSTPVSPLVNSIFTPIHNRPSRGLGPLSASVFLFILGAPILLPYVLIESQLDGLRARRAVGDPPYFAPGCRMRDYLDKYVVHPIQRRRLRWEPRETFFHELALPMEVLENIIDHCDDRRTLMACSLVCSSWTPRARNRLFRHNDIVIKRMRAYDLVKLLRSPSYTVAKHIQGLRIEEEEYWEVAESVLSELVRSKGETSVQRIHLSLSSSFNLSPVTLSSLGLTHLHITHQHLLRNIPLESVLRLACAFPHLESLALTFTHLTNYTGAWSDLSNCPFRQDFLVSSRLRKIYVKLTGKWKRGSNIILRTLLLSQASLPLESLELLHRFDPEDYPLLLECLQRHGRGLGRLGLLMEDSTLPEHDCECPSLLPAQAHSDPSRHISDIGSCGFV